MKMYTFMKKNNKNSVQAPEMMPRQSAPAMWAVNIGLLLIAVATLLPLIHITGPWFQWIYASGAALTLAGRLGSLGAYRGMSLRVRRLGRMELWTAVMFAVGTFFVFWPKAGRMDWLAFTLAGAALQTYSSIMIPKAIRKGE